MITVEELFDAFISKKSDEVYYASLKESLSVLGFKLYRYVSLSDFCTLNKQNGKRLKTQLLKPTQYGVLSIVQKYLYHNKPDFFNDPFDCNFGMGINTFFLEIMQLLGDFKGAKREMTSLENLPRVRSIGELRAEIDKQQLSSPIRDLLHFILDCTSESLEEVQGESVNMDNLERKFMLKFLENPQFLISFLRPQFQTEQSIQSLQNQLQNHKEQLINNIDDFQSLNIIDKPDFTGFLNVAGKYMDPNDLMKSAQKSINTVDNFNAQVFSLINSQFGICSLTQVFNDPLMWAHYADSHKGMIVEYDYKDILSLLQSNHIFLYPVMYSNTRVTIDTSIMENIDINSMTEPDKHTLMKLFVKGLLTKKTEWKIEQEWRSIKILAGNTISEREANRKSSSPKISAIYFGNKMPNHIKTAIAELIDDPSRTDNPMLFEMINDVQNYEIKPVPFHQSNEQN